MALRLAVAVFMVFFFFKSCYPFISLFTLFLELNFPKIFLKLLCFRSFFF